MKSQQARKEKITGSRRLASTPSPIFQPAFDMFDGYACPLPLSTCLFFSDNTFAQSNGDLAIPMLVHANNNNDLIFERVDQVRVGDALCIGSFIAGYSVANFRSV